MFYYKLMSSHWTGELEFKSTISLKEGQCFRIKEHAGTERKGLKKYPTRFKVIEISEAPEYDGQVVEILEVDLDVEDF